MRRSGERPVDDFHRQLGSILWDNCGINRNSAGLNAGIQFGGGAGTVLIRVAGSGANFTQRDIRRADRRLL